MSDWQGPRVAVVTGAGSGIGLGIARRLADDGAAVAVLDLDGDSARSVAAAIVAAGGSAVGLAVDVTERDEVRRAVAEVAERLGPPLILVNNAGRSSFVAFLELTVEEWRRTVEVNLTGTFHCCQAVLPHMVAAGWGRIVNISSSSARSGPPRMAPYASAKAGVLALTKCLAREFGPAGVTVNAIPPAFVDTPMLRQAAASGNLDMEAAIGATPVRRPGRPEDIAAACSYLCREEAGYVTGHVLAVDGGRP